LCAFCCLFLLIPYYYNATNTLSSLLLETKQQERTRRSFNNDVAHNDDDLNYKLMPSQQRTTTTGQNNDSKNNNFIFSTNGGGGGKNSAGVHTSNNSFLGQVLSSSATSSTTMITTRSSIDDDVDSITATNMQDIDDLMKNIGGNDDDDAPNHIGVTGGEEVDNDTLVLNPPAISTPSSSNKNTEAAVDDAITRIDHDDTLSKDADDQEQETTNNTTNSDMSNIIFHQNDTHKNPIQLENELPGSPDWILSKPAIGREVEGYMSRTSVNRGENISLYYNVNPTNLNMTSDQQEPANVTIEVFRTGWYGGIGARKVLGPIQVPGIFQVIPQSQKDGLIICNWTNPYIIETMVSWTTGVYLVKMTEMNTFTQSYAIFVLRDDRFSILNETGSDIMFQLPVNTYQAYNRWGGKSLYGCYDRWGGYNMEESGNCPQARKVSFDRPYAQPWNTAGAFGMGAGEYLSNVQPIASYPIKSTASWNYNMVRWLERNNLDVTYITNLDVHTRLHRLSKPKVFLTQGHDEYWTWAMRDHVTSWRDEGIHLAFLGSNTAFWQIRYENVSNNGTDFEEPCTVVCFRWPRKDPDKSNYRSIKWRDIRPEALMVGVEYVFPLGDPFDEDVIVSNHSHWLFNGTGVVAGDKIHGILGYEVDRIANTKPRHGNTEEEIPISGIIKIFETPLITRMNQSIVAQSVIYEARSGSVVFGAGTMQWSWGLDDYGVQQGLRTSRLSSVIDRMTWNYLTYCGISNSSIKSMEVVGVGRQSNVDKGEASNDYSSAEDEKNHFEHKVNNDSWVTNLTKAHMSGWIYEPSNVDFFWKKMGDRPFLAEFYSRLGNFSRIIDVGVRGYNRYCKTMINSTTTKYFQIEPFPPESSDMNNDELLNCYMQEVKDKFPALKSSFDLVIDFGVFGWGNVVAGFGETGVREYIKSVLFLLKDKGCWALKTDKGWSDTYSPTPAEFFDKYILPYFDLGDEFNGYKSGHSLRRGNFVFYFFYKK
jgi:hypothetical protein